jgi:hypothetical protein
MRASRRAPVQKRMKRTVEMRARRKTPRVKVMKRIMGIMEKTNCVPRKVWWS